MRFLRSYTDVIGPVHGVLCKGGGGQWGHRLHPRIFQFVGSRLYNALRELMNEGGGGIILRF